MYTDLIQVDIKHLKEVMRRVVFCPLLECLTSDVGQSFHPKAFNYKIYTLGKLASVTSGDMAKIDQLECDGVELCQ